MPIFYRNAPRRQDILPPRECMFFRANPAGKTGSRFRLHPFSAPILTPPIIIFWKQKNNAIGTRVINAAITL